MASLTVLDLSALRLIAEGNVSSETAAALSVTVPALAELLVGIRRKLGVATTAGAIAASL